MEKPRQRPNLVVEPLVQESLRLIAYSEHPLAHSSEVQLSDLQDQPMVLTEAGCGYRRLLEETLALEGMRLQAPMEFHSVEAIKQCVMAGIGLTFLPLVAVADEIAAGKLSPLPWPGLALEVVTQMVWHKDKWLSPALRAFLGVAREVLGRDTAAGSR